MKYALALAALTSLLGCKTPGTSEVKHNFGETERAGPGNKACDQSKVKSKSPELDAYLRGILLKLTDANPQTFKGALAPDKICISVTLMDVVNAFANSDTNSISVTSQAILFVDTEAELAGIIAHELAHLTMQHRHTDAAPPSLTLKPEWVKFREAHDRRRMEIYAEWTDADEQYGLMYGPLRDASNALSKKLPAELKDRVMALDAKRYEFPPIWVEDKKLDPATATTWTRELFVLPDVTAEAQGGLSTSGDQASEGQDVPPQRSREEVQKLIGGDIATFNAEAQALYKQMEAVAPSEYQAWYKVVAEQFELAKKLLVVEDKLIANVKEFNDMVETLAGEGVPYNWTEQEADEVGYEFFLRAKLAPESYLAVSRRNLKDAGLRNCINTYVKTGNAPTRGRGTHPEGCWRVYDILYLEAKIHAKEYGPLLKDAKVETFNLDAFQKAKDLAINLKPN